ncbi:MAG TPA: hypothetical protein VNJ54_17890 [Plantibacter sp.]|uniref:hypothetical protein n=1 Tax=unclassified Plantibacter TaxID=2624265 RepID=UPI002BB69BC2|nr:hypothetical protein [Plantibacter sp.]
MSVELTIRSLELTLHDGDVLGLAETLQSVLDSSDEGVSVNAWVGIPHGFIAVDRRAQSTGDIELVATDGAVLATLTVHEALDAIRVIRGHYS